MQKNSKHHIQQVVVENYSNTSNDWKKQVPILKKRNYIIDKSVSVGGDAPKEFIKVYEYGRSKRNNQSKWIAYIAKIGHKWYPIESITEHLLNRIGELLGLNMAHSKLAILGNQLFFLSEYFLDSRQYELVHGVDIYAGFVYDKQLVEEIEAKALARTFFTFEFAQQAINKMFPNEAEQLIEDFVKLLFFDAIVGNNDRHFYNWAILRHIENKKSPIFAPIFDTARGLFWNENEDKITERLKHPKQLDAQIEKYAKNSMPKTGWEGEQNLNHFQLAQKLCENDKKFSAILDDLLKQENENCVIQLIDNEFNMLLSDARKELVKYAIRYRFKKLRSFIQTPTL